MKTTLYILFTLLLLTYNANAQNPNTKKYVNHTEFGGLFGRVKYLNQYNGNQEQVDNKLNLTVQTFNGIQINKRLITGVTVGMDWYRAALLNPIAAGLRYDLTRKGNVKVFGTLDAGYAFAWFHDDAEGYDTRGGVMVNPGLGLRIGKDAGFTLALTYKRQEAQVDKPPFSDQTERSEQRVYNRLAMRLGISF
ncbi:hypothetical protein [Dyadobacter arcticus]|uniref:Outer membrane protein beta-barrel domain-containing protein n=1 Tax=Dyadobacter arcticus TaxID=1078754 RepID=A0ABX0UD72_9BACT|nr:hypothetical protein [Dyadobacter arcticus]NIJ50959.1 hypothetical protein [Dyadobacter arcticus]